MSIDVTALLNIAVVLFVGHCVIDAVCTWFTK